MRSTSCSIACPNSTGWPQRQNAGGKFMNTSLRTTTAASLVVLASLLGGCAASQSQVRGTQFGGNQVGDVGLATRALAALNSNDVPTATDLAERAVAKTPNDAGFRTLLGNAYFAGGRFRSAEAA